MTTNQDDHVATTNDFFVLILLFNTILTEPRPEANPALRATARKTMRKGSRKSNGFLKTTTKVKDTVRSEHSKKGDNTNTARIMLHWSEPKPVQEFLYSAFACTSILVGLSIPSRSPRCVVGLAEQSLVRSDLVSNTFQSPPTWSGRRDRSSYECSRQ